MKMIWCKTPKFDPKVLHVYAADGSLTDEDEYLRAHQEVERPVLNPLMRYLVINKKCDTIKFKESPASHADRGLRLVPNTIDANIKGLRRDMLVTQPPVADVVIGRSDTKWGMYEAHNEKGVTIGDVLDAQEKFNPQKRIQGMRGWQ